MKTLLKLTCTLLTSVFILNSCDILKDTPEELAIGGNPYTSSVLGDGDYENSFVFKPTLNDMVRVNITITPDASKNPKGADLNYGIYKDADFNEDYTNHLFIPVTGNPIIPVTEEVFINIEAFLDFYGEYTIEIEDVDEKQLIPGADWETYTIGNEKEEWFYVNTQIGKDYTFYYKDTRCRDNDLTAAVVLCICYSDLGAAPYENHFALPVDNSASYDTLVVNAEETRIYVNVSLLGVINVDDPSGTFALKVE